MDNVKTNITDFIFMITIHHDELVSLASSTSRPRVVGFCVMIILGVTLIKIFTLYQ